MLPHAMFNKMARYMQQPSLRFIAHQPTLRQVFELQAMTMFRPVSGVSVREAIWGGIPGLELVPDGIDGPPSFLYLHGGGFTIGSPRTHKWLVARIAKLAGCVAFLPKYRLAPEHPYPAAVDDCDAAFEALAAQGPVDVGGDSAGGCVALHLCAQYAPRRAVLLSPVVDLTDISRLHIEADFSEEILLPEVWIRRVVALYLGNTPPDDPRISPIFADLSAAPPTLIQVAAGEVLESHARRAADALPQATLQVTPNVAHVWQLNAGWMQAADDAVAELAAFLSAPA